MSNIKSTEEAKKAILERIAAKISAQKTEIHGAIRHSAHLSHGNRH